jgi:hypothetical protein
MNKPRRRSLLERLVEAYRSYRAEQLSKEEIDGLADLFGGAERVRMVLRGELEVVIKDKTAPIPDLPQIPVRAVPEVSAFPDSPDPFAAQVGPATVEVNRKVAIRRHPNGFVEFHKPALQSTGPSMYDLKKDVKAFFHPTQQAGQRVPGMVVYRHLLTNEAQLERCLGLYDAVAIQAKGAKFFRDHFAGTVPFWRSVARFSVAPEARVPCLHLEGNEVVFAWRPIEENLQPADPLLMWFS